MFAVIWRDEALDELADVWVSLGPRGREELAREVAALNARLAADPQNEGESRGDAGRRVTFVTGIAVGLLLEPGGGVRVTRFGGA